MRALLLVAALGAAAPSPYPVVRPGVVLVFPRDHGAHPDFRTEWWYVTGWVTGADGRARGFQVTFFRSRPRLGENNPSRFAPRQILFAHAALSDPAVGRLLHDDRAARAGFGLAGARVGDADVAIRDWRLRRLPDGRWAARIAARDFALDLVLTPRQPIFEQGERGYSRKGPDPAQASHYYSIPHLAVNGSVARGGRPVRVRGEAWLDREWSSTLLAPGATGWDWTGLNFDDGGALVAFRIRGARGGDVWAGGSYRRPDGRVARLGRGDVRFVPLAWWTSPATRARYPVAQRVVLRLPEGERRFDLRPLFPAQELDGRRSGLSVYWEGAVRTEGGRGYLELTGYAAPLRL
jgi:predicted secreted hydrolase